MPSIMNYLGIYVAPANALAGAASIRLQQAVTRIKSSSWGSNGNRLSLQIRLLQQGLGVPAAGTVTPKAKLMPIFWLLLLSG